MQFLASSSQETILLSHNATKTCGSFKSAIQSFLFILSLLVVVKIVISTYSPMQTSELKIIFNQIETNLTIWNSKSTNLQRNSGKLFCTIFSTNYQKMFAINHTWLQQCDHGEFFTDTKFDDESLPVRTVYEKFPGYDKNTILKSIYGLMYAYEKISDQFLWYFHTNDDVFVIIDNLNNYLSAFNSSKPILIDFREENGRQVVIFSKAAMELLSSMIHENGTFCKTETTNDIDMISCLKNIGIFVVDSDTKDSKYKFTSFSASNANDLEENLAFYDKIDKTSELLGFDHLQPSDFQLVYLVQHSIKNNHHRCRRRYNF